MHSQTRSSSIFLLSLFLSGSLAAGDSELVGCKELGCPPNGAYHRCTVSDNTLDAVGEAPISGVPQPLQGVSLVKGLQVGGLNLTGDNTADTENRPFRSVYYLGTPSSVNTDDLSGCAVVFDFGSTKKFSDDDRESASGTCPDIIDQKCIDALTDRAGQVTDCNALSRALHNDDWDECRDMAGTGAGLGNFSVTPLSDLEPITQAQNSSSDCWPVPNKSDNLAVITSNTTMGNYRVDGVTDNMYRINPVLTLFKGGNGADTGLEETVAQLTCLKAVIEENEETEDREVSGEGDSGASSTFSRNSLGAAAVVLAAMMFTGV